MMINELVAWQPLKRVLIGTADAPDDCIYHKIDQLQMVAISSAMVADICLAEIIGADIEQA